MKKGVLSCMALLVMLFSSQMFLLPMPGGSGTALGASISGADLMSISHSSQPEFVPDEIIVKFKAGIDQQKKIDAVCAEYHLTVKSVNHRAEFMVLKIQDKSLSVEELVQKFRNDEEVEYAELNYLVHTCLSPNDPGYPKAWGLDNTGQTGGLPDADIDAPEAWNIQTGSPSVIVAVIDSGVDYNHVDLASNIWTNPGEIPGNGIDDDGNGFIDDVRGWDFLNHDNDPMDDLSHGTHCAGTIAAVGNNGTGVVGVNWVAGIMPLKFIAATGYGSTSDAVLAIQYAVRMGAKVMSSSWGGGGYSQSLKNAIDEAGRAGVLFVAAAGNSGTNNDVSPFYPASYDLPYIIAVAATSHDDKLASFSNYGLNSVDLGAPGVSIFSTLPNNGYGFMSGTSMATPHVSGVAALLVAENPGLALADIKAGILNSVDRIPSLAGKTFSEGRLDAYHALTSIAPPLPPPVVTTIFQDDMESGINGWTASTGSLWHQSSHRSASPITSWYYGIEGVYNYDTGSRNSGSITSPAVNLTGVASSTLVFTHFLATENFPPHDTAKVRISKDGGATFKDILSKTTTSGTFITETLNIPEFDGCVIRIQFLFDTLDGALNRYEGWYVDDVTVRGKIVVPPVNQPPVAVAGPDRTVADADGNGAEGVTLDGSGSYDPDGTIVSFEWREGETLLGSGMTITHNFSVAGSPHKVTLKVTDDKGETASDELIITVRSNQPPVAEAGPNQSVSPGGTVTFDASGSYDPDGIIVSYDWNFGDGTAHGSGKSVPHVYSAPGNYTVTLTVTDNGGLSGVDTSLVTVSGKTLHVGDISMSLKNVKQGSIIYTNAMANVLILDGLGIAVKGVTVYGHWSGLTSDTDSGLTGANGKVSLISDKVKNARGTFTFTVDKVTLTGWIYDPSANVETSDSITTSK